MKLINRVLLVLAVTALPLRPARAQLIESFESGSGFNRSGSLWIPVPADSSNAFWNQPTYDENVSVDRVNPPGSQGSVGGQSPVGGDFWKTPYPINKDGDWWIGTFENRPTPNSQWGVTQGDSPKGVLYSPVFLIGPDKPKYLSFLIAGGSDSVHEKVELVTVTPSAWVQECLDATPLSRGLFDRNGCGDRAPWQVVNIQNNGQTMPARATGNGGEIFTPVTWNVAAGHTASTPVRLRISDLSGASHINVDGIRQITSVVPGYVAQSPLWGFADLHTHWMSNLAFGALQNSQPSPDLPFSYYLDTMRAMIWGQPYRPNMSGFPNDSPQALGYQFGYAMGGCDQTTHQGNINHQPQDVAGLRTNAATSYLLATLNNNEGNSGCNGTLTLALWGTSLFTWPFLAISSILSGGPPPPLDMANCGHVGFGAGRNVWGNIDAFHRSMSRPYMDLVHQQMYWEWVRRAWRSGLRVMVVDALNEITLEAAISNYSGIPANSISTGHPADDAEVWHATDDLVTINRQTRALKKLMLEPEIAAFAAIAYNPDEARKIIIGGRLAIIMGTELDGLGSLRGMGTDASSIDNEIAYLKSIGIRKLIPIHMTDNTNGGAGVYDQTLASASDFMNGGGNCFRSDQIAASPEWMRTTTPDVGEIRCGGAWRLGDWACGSAPPDPQNDTWHCYLPLAFPTVENGCPSGRAGDGYCSNFMLGYSPLGTGSWGLFPSLARLVTDKNMVISTQGNHFTGTRPAMNAFGADVIGAIPGVIPSGGHPTPPGGVDVQSYGMRNAAGLTTHGATYIASMMANSLIIDIEHMSEKSYQAVIGKSPGSGSTAVQGAIWGSDDCSQNYSKDYCRGQAYPVIASHTGFRELAVPLDFARTADGTSTESISKVASERSKTPEDVMRIVSSGGIIGVGTGYSDSLSVPGAPTNDCAGTTKNWLQSYYYVRKKISDVALTTFNDLTPVPSGWSRGIAIGTDFNGLQPELGPEYLRPGDADTTHQCPGRDDGDRAAGPGMNSQAAEAAVQNQRWMNGVVYNDSPAPAHTSPGSVCAPGQEAYCNSVIVDGQPPLQRLVVTYNQNANTDSQYDINYDGLANYGMIPDFLQTAVNNGAVNNGGYSTAGRAQTQSDLRNLYRSAEDFIRMWEQAIKTCRQRGNTRCLSNTVTDDPIDVVNQQLRDPWDPTN